MQHVLQVARVQRGILSVAVQFAAAALLGAVVIYGAGFSQTAEAHNAAHDSRHTHAFPCH